jgi:hypothetical protein
MMDWRSIEEPDEPVVVLRGIPATTPASYERFYRRRRVASLGLLAFLLERTISWSVAITAHLLLAAAFLGIYVHVSREDDGLVFASLFRGNAGEEGKKLETPAFEPAKEEAKEPQPPKPEPPKPEPAPETPKPPAVEKAPEKDTPAPNPVAAAADASPKPASVGSGASATGKSSAPVSDAEVEKDPTAALRARRAGDLDQLRHGSQKDIVVVRGQYDSVELVLARLGIPHRVVDPEKLPETDLSGSKILLVNCHTLYGAYLFKEADTRGLEKLIDQLDAKAKDLDRRIAATKDPRTLFKLRLDYEQTTSYLGECRRRLEGLAYSGKLADAVGAFVRKGGYVFTSDWGLSILERALPGYVKNGGNVGPKTVAIRPRAGKEKHEILEGVFYEGARGSTTPYKKFLWEIDSASYLVKVERPAAVETLVESAELPRCPAVAVVITPDAEAGARPGRVLHILSHFQKQATQQGDYALQSMLLNFMLDCVRPPERRAAVLPEVSVAAPPAPSAPRAEFSGVHRDEKGRWTLAVPKGWTLAQTGDPASPIVLEKPGEGVRATLSVTAPPERVERAFDWAPYVRALVEGMERQADEVKVTKKTQAFSNGHPAYSISITFQKGNARWGVLHHAVVTPQATYALSWTAPGDSFRDWEPLFDQACKAFHVAARSD